MDTVETLTQLDGIRLSDWIESRGLSRSTAYELLKLLQIEPEARRVPTSRKPVSHLTADQLELLDPLADEINRGATLPQIRDRLGRCGIVPDNAPGRSDIIPADHPKRSAIVPDSSPGSSAIVPDGTTGPLMALSPDQFVGFLEVLQSAATPAAPEPTAAPTADPLARARGLAEAADNGLVLTREDLAALIGHGTDRWSDGTEKYGYRFQRHQQGRQVLWTVERAITTSGTITSGNVRALPAATSRPVGFAATIDASYRVVGTLPAAELFQRNRIGY